MGQTKAEHRRERALKVRPFLLNERRDEGAGSAVPSGENQLDVGLKGAPGPIRGRSRVVPSAGSTA